MLYRRLRFITPVWICCLFFVLRQHHGPRICVYTGLTWIAVSSHGTHATHSAWTRTFDRTLPVQICILRSPHSPTRLRLGPRLFCAVRDACHLMPSSHTFLCTPYVCSSVFIRLFAHCLDRYAVAGFFLPHLRFSHAFGHGLALRTHAHLVLPFRTRGTHGCLVLCCTRLHTWTAAWFFTTRSPFCTSHWLHSRTHSRLWLRTFLLIPPRTPPKFGHVPAAAPHGSLWDSTLFSHTSFLFSTHLFGRILPVHFSFFLDTVCIFVLYTHCFATMPSPHLY